MLGRRRNERFRFIEPAAAAVDLFYDVIVKWNADNEWIAVSREPAFPGEVLVLDVDDGERRNQLTVHVIESSPVIVDGDMRHRIRLQPGAHRPVLFEQQVRRG
jgi:hypothetical protein